MGRCTNLVALGVADASRVRMNGSRAGVQWPRRLRCPGVLSCGCIRSAVVLMSHLLPQGKLLHCLASAHHVPLWPCYRSAHIC
jgi:hypothetical protein